MLSNIVLDWSGTVVDDHDAVVKATNSVLGEFGREALSKAQFCREFVLPFESFYRRFLPDIPAGKIDEVYQRFFHHYEDEVELLPGVGEFLDYCRKSGRRMFVLSTLHRDHFRGQVERFGLHEYFDRTYLQALDKREVIGRLLSENNLVARKTAFIGDMVHDIETARHGGVMAIATLTGFDSAEKLIAARPDLMVGDLNVLKNLLEGFSGEEWIEISNLEVFPKIGVLPEERLRPQRLLVDLRFQIPGSFAALEDQFGRTVDYSAVAASVVELADQNQAQLLETMAEAIANSLLAKFEISAVDVVVKKFILPNAGHVSARTVQRS